jgi:hypothetical protein
VSFTTFKKKHRHTPTEMVSVADTSRSKTSDAELCLKGRLPLIKCECGTEILLVPDLKAMDRAIDAHVAEHRKKANNPSRAATSSRISQLLALLTLRKASDYTRR